MWRSPVRWRSPPQPLLSSFPPHHITNSSPRISLKMSDSFRPWQIQQDVRSDEPPDPENLTANFWPKTINVRGVRASSRGVLRPFDTMLTCTIQLQQAGFVFSNIGEEAMLERFGHFIELRKEDPLFFKKVDRGRPSKIIALLIQSRSVQWEFSRSRVAELTLV